MHLDEILTIKGKNLFDPTTMGTNEHVWISNGVLKQTNDNSGVIIPIIGGKTYTISHNISDMSIFRACTYTKLLTDAEKASGVTVLNAQSKSTGVTSITLTAGANDKYMYIQINGNKLTTFNSVCQIEEGSAATTYEPYKGEFKSIGNMWERAIETESAKGNLTTTNNTRKCVNLINISDKQVGYGTGVSMNVPLNKVFTKAGDYIFSYKTETDPVSVVDRFTANSVTYKASIISTSDKRKIEKFTFTQADIDTFEYITSNVSITCYAASSGSTTICSEFIMHEGSTAQPYYPYFSATQVLPNLKAFGGTVQEIQPLLWGRYVPVEYISNKDADTSTVLQASGFRISTDLQWKDIGSIQGQIKFDTDKATANIFMVGISDKTTYSPPSNYQAVSKPISSPNVYSGSVAITTATSVFNLDGTFTYNLRSNTNEQWVFISGWADNSWTSGMNYYYMRIYDINSELIRNYIPVKDTINNTYGMFDTVEQKFYGNSGTGTFIAGPEIKPVEYIDSGVDRAWLSTNFTPTLNTDVEVLGQKSGGTSLFGADTNIFTITGSGATTTCYLCGSSTSFPNEDFTKKIYSFIGNTITTGTETKTVTRGTTAPRYPLALFARSTSATTVNDAAQNEKIWYAKIWDNNVLVRHLIPVKIDTEYCMYDNVEHKVYRKSGSASFTGGNEIPWRLLYPYSLVGNRGEIKYGQYGKNLFDKTAVKSGYYLNNNGEEISSNGWNISDYMPVIGGETYYQRLRTAGTSPRTCWYSANKQFIYAVAQLAGGTQTAPLNAAYCRMSVNSQSSSTSDIDYGMFTKGSTAPTEYEPYHFGFHADGEHKVNILGKNLFDTSKKTDGYFLNRSGQPTSQSDWSVSDYIEVNPNTSYYISGVGTLGGSAYHCLYDSNKTCVSTTRSGESVITTSSSVAYLRISLRKSFVNTTQIELGSSATSYEPYFKQIADVNELLYSPNDYVDIQQGKRYNACAIKVFDGTESFTYYSVAQGNLFRYQPRNRFNEQLSVNGKCNRYQVTTSSARGNGSVSSPDINIDFIDDRFTTIDGFVDYLKKCYDEGNPVIIIYKLATPTEISIQTTPISLTTKGAKNVVGSAEIPVSEQARYLGK